MICLLLLSREWMGCWGLLGVAGMIITSDDWDHSRKFPPFSTSKFVTLTSLHICTGLFTGSPSGLLGYV